MLNCALFSRNERQISSNVDFNSDEEPLYSTTTTETTTTVTSTTQGTQPTSRPQASNNGISTNLDFDRDVRVPVETTTIISTSDATIASTVLVTEPSTNAQPNVEDRINAHPTFSTSESYTESPTIIDKTSTEKMQTQTSINGEAKPYQSIIFSTVDSSNSNTETATTETHSKRNGEDQAEMKSSTESIRLEDKNEPPTTISSIEESSKPGIELFTVIGTEMIQTSSVSSNTNEQAHAEMALSTESNPVDNNEPATTINLNEESSIPNIESTVFTTQQATTHITEPANIGNDTGNPITEPQVDLLQ